MVGQGPNRLSVSQAAVILGADPESVRSFIKSGILSADKIDGRYQIAEDDVVALANKLGRGRTRSPSVMGRRRFVKGLGGLALAVASSGFYDAAKAFWIELDQEQEAIELFRSLFGYVDSGSQAFDYSLGRMKYDGPHGYHPDNWATGVSLAGPLGLPDIEQIRKQPHQTMNLEGDLFVIGGSSSTDETMIAWELEGPNDRQLRRRADPILPLRWFGIADEKDPYVLDTSPIAYRYQGVGAQETVAWPIVEADPSTGQVQRHWTPQPGKKVIEVGDKKLPLPTDNYLYISRIPNVLDSEFPSLQRGHKWGHMLIFGGSNGIGTRAAALLPSAAGLPALRAAHDSLKGASEFQVLFRVEGLIERFGHHEFEKIDFIDSYRLDSVVSGTRYMDAHLRATRRVESGLPPWVRAAD
jgi:hypothetical protein